MSEVEGEEVNTEEPSSDERGGQRIEEGGSRTETLHPLRWHVRRSNQYGVGSLSAGVRRGKINCTRQPPAENMLPKHGAFNEASETRCDQRGQLHRIRALITHAILTKHLVAIGQCLQGVTGE
ncbi:hypothetical protein M404DRAFT_999406 [Pisolithus tinctorius Marx 270]|uniref:Uncharacterized protein n=1 Tax=Pisolithus tinctorius Marx 270 TaxID=870435 RepID=A0A0C3K996_PISTI|nr:hypothetical protein M404DRAFT_999406 [Pisolithus tinctorius Marx 270]